MIYQDMQLRRVCYQTDRNPETDPEYIGVQLRDVIPASAFRDGDTIVDVDWNQEPGYVWVTFLSPAR